MPDSAMDSLCKLGQVIEIVFCLHFNYGYSSLFTYHRAVRLNSSLRKKWPENFGRKIQCPVSAICIVSIKYRNYNIFKIAFCGISLKMAIYALHYNQMLKILWCLNGLL